ncbi:MAG: diaminopimelate decarboxylase [Bacteriovoracia bacterium]
MSKPLDYFTYQAQNLTTSGADLSQIAEEYGTPAYVYSEAGLLEPVRGLTQGLTGWDPLICYAVKSSSNVTLLRRLAEAGAGMDIVSGGELYRCGKAGVPGRKIVFSGVGKTRTEIAEALQFGPNGIYSFHVESGPELEAIGEVAHAMGKRAPIAFRYNPNIAIKSHPYISTGLRKDKFGLPEKELLALVEKFRDHPGLYFKGVSIHIGSQILTLAPLRDAFARTIDLVAKLDARLPEPVTYVDVGGGLGITYKNEKHPKISEYCALIKKSFGKLRKSRNLQIVMEPGRLISGNAGLLLSRVLYRKPGHGKDFLIVDAAMNDLIRPSLYESHHEIVPVRKKPGTKQTTFDVVGPVCESGDFIAQNRKLPDSLQAGDLVAILSAGAYGFSMASNYNSRPRACEVLIADTGRPQLIRRRETYDELIAPEL